MEGFVDASGQHNTLTPAINEFVTEVKNDVNNILRQYGFDDVKSIKVITYKADVSEFSKLSGTSINVEKKRNDIYKSFFRYQQYPALFGGWDARACINVIIGEISNEESKSSELHVVLLCYPNHTIEN